MKVFVVAVLLLIAVSVAVGAAEPVKVSINVKDQTVAEVAKLLVKQVGQDIIVDPKIDKNVTAALGNLELPKMLDVVCANAGATWKKVQFAKKEDSKVLLDQIKASILALATLPMVAVSVQDSTGKNTSMYAKELPSSPDTSSMKLPDGYAWTTAYVIYIPEVAVEKTVAEGAAAKDKVEAMGKEAAGRPMELAKMTSEERQRVFQNELAGYMTLTPEARQGVLKDQISTMFSMSPEAGQQYMSDMRQAMKSMGGMGGGRQRGGNGGAATGK